MKFLRVIDGVQPTTFVGTIDEAKTIVRSFDKTFRSRISVEEVEMPTDKASLIRLLNGCDESTENEDSLSSDDDIDRTGIVFTTLRTWYGTARGGLQLSATSAMNAEKSSGMMVDGPF